MTGTIDFRTPGAGFDQPVEMWLACHERVQRFAALLSRLADHLSSQGADEDAQVTAVSIRRYFNERRRVTTRTRRSTCSAAARAPRQRTRRTVLDVLEQVEADHLEMAGLWSARRGLAEISPASG